MRGESVTGKGRPADDGYLDLARSIVEAFTPFQSADGRILDPVDGVERQYATPAFACGAAIVATSSSGLAIEEEERRRLLEAAVRAMDASVANLRGGSCDGHADFFTILAMYAYNALVPHVAGERLEGWRRSLAAIDPEERYQVVLSKSPGRLHNWNVVALAGEFHRWKAGLSDSLEWVEEYLAHQMERFTPEGLFEDPGAPLAYDLFARQFIADMLASGYRGAFAKPLADRMDRSALYTLGLQSPCGEWPTGGRSAQHQWNEAQLALFLEATARRWVETGAATEAVGQCRRGARSAANSIRRWLRPEGDLWIVKNRYPPKERHGYEPYSFHSQYNLLTAALLAIAATHARAIPRENVEGEGGAPPRSTVVLGPPFAKVAVASGGYYLLINTGGNEGYDPSGLIRVHRAGCPSTLLFSEGAVKESRYHVPGERLGNLSACAWWREGEGWTGIADLWGERLDAHVERAPGAGGRECGKDGVGGDESLSIRWSSGGRPLLQTTYQAGPGGVLVTERALSIPRPFRVSVPFLLFDGETAPAWSVSGNVLTVARDGAQARVTLLGGGAWHVSEARYPARSGVMQSVWATVEGEVAQYRIEMAPPGVWQE